MPARTNAPVGRGLQLATKYCKFSEGRESIKIASALPALLGRGNSIRAKSDLDHASQGCGFLVTSFIEIAMK